MEKQPQKDMLFLACPSQHLGLLEPQSPGVDPPQLFFSTCVHPAGHEFYKAPRGLPSRWWVRDQPRAEELAEDNQMMSKLGHCNVRTGTGMFGRPEQVC